MINLVPASNSSGVIPSPAELGDIAATVNDGFVATLDIASGLPNDPFSISTIVGDFIEPDPILSFAYNFDPVTQTRRNANRPYITVNMEGHYVFGGQTAVEWHLNVGSITSQGWASRPIFVTSYPATERNLISLRGEVYFTDSQGNSADFTIANGRAAMSNGIPLYADYNNAPCLFQRNAALSGWILPLGVNTSDEVVLGWLGEKVLGYFKPRPTTDNDAPSGVIYYSTDSSSLSYKTDAGSVRRITTTAA